MRMLHMGSYTLNAFLPREGEKPVLKAPATAWSLLLDVPNAGVACDGGKAHPRAPHALSARLVDLAPSQHVHKLQVTK